MEMRETVALVAALASICLSPGATADSGVPGESPAGAGGWLGQPPVMFGGDAQAAAWPLVDVVDAGPLRLTQLSPRATYDPLVDQTAQAYGLESALLHAVIHAESSYNPRAVSKQGAQGLMQLMPDTARRYGVSDAFDPAQNLSGGARYLRDLLTIFHNDLQLVLAAYNAGENAVIRHGYRVPPLKATVAYVARVLHLYRHNMRAEMGLP